MKKVWIVIVLGLFIIGFSSSGFSQEAKVGLKQGDKICPEKMHGMGYCCPIMMGKSLVATADGGVVVMCCNKLFKYDKDLVFQKEVEIKMDKEGMMKKAEPCPMKEKMKSEGKAKEEPK